MIVAVTGGSGFIGRHVVSQLRTTGHECRVVDVVLGDEDVPFYQCDITDLDGLTEALGGVDGVIHLAALADFADVDRNPARARAVNADGTSTVLRAAVRAGVRRVVYGSTFWVYDGLDGQCVDEDTAPRPPRHLYTETKLDGERHCRCIDGGLPDVVICRLGTAYGPGARAALMTSRMLDAASRGQPLTINGDGSQGRQLTYVGDLADGLVSALSDGRPGATYNLVGPRVISVREVADEVRSLLGDVAIVHTPSRANDVRMPLVVADRAARDLRWQPNTALRDGLARQLVHQLARVARSNGDAHGPAAVGILNPPIPDRDGESTWPLTVSGWAVGLDSAVSSVDITLDGGPPRPAGLHRLRPGLAAIGQTGAEFAGFEALTGCTAAVTGRRVRIEATVELLDGTRLALPAHETTVSTSTSAEVAPSLRRNRWSRVPRRRPDPIRLLMWARALGGGGSQLRMCELTEALASHGGFRTTIASPLEGPLRPELEAAGAKVEVVPRVRFQDHDTYRKQVEDATEWARGRFDLVYAPTLTSFPGIDVAATLGVPSVWRIGEVEPLTTVAGWLGDRVHPSVEQRAGLTYRIANRVLFNSRRGLEVRRGEGFNGRFQVLDTGVDIAAAHDFITQFDRTQCRRLLDLPESGRLLVCTASVWPVKAQATLVTAFRHASLAHPNLRLAIVGEHRQPYTAAISRLIERSGLDDVVRLVPLVRDVRPWLRAADALVLSSESESMPTSALEAMAFGLPVLATDVGGVREIVIDGKSGWLCNPCDVRSLIGALNRVADASDAELRTLGICAAALMAAEHDRSAALARMTRLLGKVAGERSIGRLP